MISELRRTDNYYLLVLCHDCFVKCLIQVAYVYILRSAYTVLLYQ